MGLNLSKIDYAYLFSKRHENLYALKDINLSIHNQNEFVAIVGHTGSGKSTLVQIFNSLIIPTNGTVEIEFREDGKNVRYEISSRMKKTKYSYNLASEAPKYQNKVILKPLRRHIGLVFQFPEYQIFEETVLKDIMFGPKNFLKDEEKAKEETLRIAKMMGIEDLLEKSPFSLSGGQMRKVAIAGILASNPDILVLDEPTVGLDPLAKKELLEFLKYLNEKENKTIIIITHDMDVVGEYAKRTIVLKKGHIMYDGSKDGMFKNEDIIKNCNLNYPTTVSLMMKLKEKLNLDMDVFQYNVNDAYQELVRVLGEKHE